MKGICLTDNLRRYVVDVYWRVCLAYSV